MLITDIIRHQMPFKPYYPTQVAQTGLGKALEKANGSPCTTFHLAQGIALEGKSEAAKLLITTGINTAPPPNESVETTETGWYGTREVENVFELALKIAGLSHEMHIIPEELLLALVQPETETDFSRSLQRAGIILSDFKAAVFKRLKFNPDLLLKETPQ